jgi:hypothetical protein
MRAFALFSLIFLLSKPVFACSICGCDPSGGNLALDRPTPSEARVTVEERYLAKESGPAGTQEYEGEKEVRVDLRVQYSPPVPRLSLQLDVPLYAWKAHYTQGGVQDDTTAGLSDIFLTARYEVMRLQGYRHVVALLGTIKTPTGGNDHVTPADNGVPDEHKQLGTGSWDGMFGASYIYGDFPTVAYAQVSARVNGTNSRGNHYGNALFGLVGVRQSVLESKQLYFSFDAQARNAGKDTMPEGVYDENSGGFIGYAVGTIGYSFTPDLLARLVLQVPVVTALNGAQSEHPVAFFAVAYDFPTMRR